MNNWKNIWNKRMIESDGFTLGSLLNADGFDSGAGNFTTDDWLEFIAAVRSKLQAESKESIFEVGCGSGAFLYPWYREGFEVSGVDYSRNLIDVANKAMPENDFIYSDANAFITSPKYDYVISNSVFQYFPNLDYAHEVLVRMISKANKKVAALDINDLSKQDLANKIRRGAMTAEEYDKKYCGLEHLFIAKSWFEGFARSYDLEIEIIDQSIPGYLNSQFRYNVFLTKKYVRIHYNLKRYEL